MAVETVMLGAFLRSGELGRITTAWTAAEVGRHLGAPSCFAVNEGDLFPGYWIYDHLEISFAAQAEFELPLGSMHWFQLESAFLFRGRHAWAAKGCLRIVLFEGLTGRSRLSSYARVLADVPGATIEAHRMSGSSDWQVSLRTARIEAIFTMGLEAEEDPPEVLSRLDDAAIARRIERQVRIDSIYSYPPARASTPRASAQPENGDGRRRWRVAAYLAAVGPDGARTRSEPR